MSREENQGQEKKNRKDSGKSVIVYVIIIYLNANVNPNKLISETKTNLW